MTTPVISPSNLDQLAEALPDLDFSDPERRAVLCVMDSIDVQAAPGSGKTTLLAAKLLLLAQKWAHPRRGICVLSHTNVARDEIAKRLSGTATGSRLLRYPHFVGTIHGFVNQFLALPLLRSEGKSVDVIDNDIFSARALSLVKHKYTLKEWLKRNPYQGPDAIATLRYEGPDLTLGWEKGSLPGAGTDSHTQAKEIKDRLTERGIFRHDDMFAFAAYLLQRFPDLRKRLSWRFPLLLIDEMQDTSWAQEYLLAQLFDESVVMQRFGDRNQRILNSEKDVEKLSFPRSGHLNVTTTKRFGKSIAAAVRTVQEHGEPVTAESDHGALAPMLLLYKSNAAQGVIEEFGRLVLRTLPNDALFSGPVKAICARKQGTANQPPGRHIGDYWPAYIIGGGATTDDESIIRLLADHPEMGVSPMLLHGRVLDVKRAILLALRAARCQAVEGVRDASTLLWKLEAAGVSSSAVRVLCRELTLGRGHTADLAAWTATVDLIYGRLRTLLPTSISRDDFGAFPIFKMPESLTPTAQDMNMCLVSQDGRSVCIHIGTIASVKGETHAATLVLEAYGGKGKCFDLGMALPNISRSTPIGSKASGSQRNLYRNLYVAMSRPRHLLCLAMNQDRAQDGDVESLVAKGWNVQRMSG